MLFLKTLLLLAFAGIVARLVNIQVLQSEKYQAIAKRQYEKRFTLPAIRGSIYDRNGSLLASNTVFVSFGIDPRAVAGRERKVALALARILPQSADVYEERLRSSKHFVWIERHVRPDVAKQVESVKAAPLFLVEEPKRLYHYDDFAGQVIGFTDLDNTGIAGLEFKFDSVLKGRDGFAILQRDGLGRTRPSVDYPRVDPCPGKSIVLTIDLAYQSIAEEELRKGVEQCKAESGIVVMMRPATGEILALAQYPPVNPNSPGTASPEAAKVRAVTDQFEPGSMFKIVTAAAGLEHGTVRPDDVIFAENGLYRAKSRVIRDSHPLGFITFRQAMERSSNIAMAKVSDGIGANRIYRMARAFGFGMPTGVDLPGEIAGDLKHPSEWSRTTLNTLAFGYEVGGTPLQIACAYGALARRGILMRPYIVRAILDSQGDTLALTRPQAIRRVVSRETADTLTNILCGVVERGTGIKARVAGLEIAGKTGTAKKHANGHYEAGKFTASFIGYLPAKDPQLLCLVMLDNPSGESYYGGATSAPVFRAIVERILNTISPLQMASPEMSQPIIAGKVPIPDVRHLRVDLAKKILRDQHLAAEAYGAHDSQVVYRQVPDHGELAMEGTRVQLITAPGEQQYPDGTVTVPNVRGFSLRRAVNRLFIDGFRTRVEGSGEVAAQLPTAGERVAAGSEITLLCEARKMKPARPLAHQTGASIP